MCSSSVKLKIHSGRKDSFETTREAMYIVQCTCSYNERDTRKKMTKLNDVKECLINSTELKLTSTGQMII